MQSNRSGQKNAEELKAELEECKQDRRRASIIKRLEVVEAFRESGNKPEWMIMDVIPVIPPDLQSYGTVGWWHVLQHLI